MIYFLSLLCSMCIQFAAIGYGDVSPDYQYIVDEIQQKLAGGNSWQQIYSRTDDIYWLVFLRDDGNYQVLIPREVPEPSYPSSDIVTSLIDDIGLNVTFYNYVFMTYNGSNVSFEWPSSRSYSFYYYNAENYYYPRLVYVGRESFYYDGEYQVNLSVQEDITVPVLLSQLGSLGHSGYSGGDSPIDSLNNSSFNWASVTGHSNGGASGPSPHSSSTHFSSTTPSPDSNDSKTDSLLYMLGNKLADITENTGAIGDALGGIMYNQVSGASALFNAISGFNDNFVSAFTPPSKEEFSSVLHTSEIYACFQNINTSIAAMTTTLNSVGQQSGYVWNITLPDSWGGSLSFDFSSYLDANTLNFIRIIIGAILIISTIVFVAHQLPDIIGGGSGGENA